MLDSDVKSLIFSSCKGFQYKFFCAPLFLNATAIRQYELRLVASDNRNENHTKVVIHVKDVNDNPPMFDRPLYETQITEEDDRALPKNILTVVSFCNRIFPHTL